MKKKILYPRSPEIALYDNIIISEKWDFLRAKKNMLGGGNKPAQLLVKNLDSFIYLSFILVYNLYTGNK